MTTLKDIRDEIIDKLQDTDFTSAWIDSRINEGLRYCSENILLPKLESSGDVSTVLGTPFIDIPDSWNYGRNLYAAEVDGAPKISVIPTLSLLYRDHPYAETELQSGDIELLSTKNDSQLFIYPIPSTVVTLKCKFYKAHTLLTEDDDVIVGIPSSLILPLLENYVLWKAYGKSEDGSENGEYGGKPNKTSYEKDFWITYQLLDDTFRTGQSWPDYYRETGWI